MVLGPAPMKVKKVPAIVRQENSVFGDGEGQDFTVRHGGVRLSGIERGEHVVS